MERKDRTGDKLSEFTFGPVKCSTYTINELLHEIQYLLSDRSIYPRTINCLNAHIFNLAWSNVELRSYLNSSRIVAADGMSIVWAARLFGTQLHERCNMTEAFRAFMLDSSFPKTRSLLIGGTEEIATKASEAINRICPHTTVIAAISGYLTEDHYRSYLEQCGPVDFVFLGLGTPKTERLSAVVSSVLPESIIWHIGGGTVLFLAKVQREAPAWMRKSGLQWLHRLLLEPSRMWKRYLIGNMLFLIRCIYWCLRRFTSMNR